MINYHRHFFCPVSPHHLTPILFFTHLQRVKLVIGLVIDEFFNLINSIK